VEWLKRGLQSRKLVCPPRFPSRNRGEETSYVSAISKTTDRVVIAIDPHKASWTAAVVDASSQPVATIRVPVSRDGYRA
jgi:transposase